MKIWEEALFDSIQEDVIPLENFHSVDFRTPEKILMSRQLNQENLTQETIQVLSLIFSAPKEMLGNLNVLRKYLAQNGVPHYKIKIAFKEIRKCLHQ